MHHNQLLVAFSVTPTLPFGDKYCGLSLTVPLEQKFLTFG